MPRRGPLGALEGLLGGESKFTVERISFYQLNLHHSMAATANLAGALLKARGYVALLQEPWTVAGVPRGFGGCGELFYSRGTLAPRASIMVGLGIKAWFLPVFEQGFGDGEGGGGLGKWAPPHRLLCIYG